MTQESDASETLGLKIFNESHTAELIVFIHCNPGCMKTQIYDRVMRTSRMNKKLEILESEGLIRMAAYNRGTTLRLTPQGERIAEHLLGIQEIMAGAPAD